MLCSVGYIRVLGQCLDPAYNLEMFPSGEFQLRYCPDGLGYVMRCFSGESMEGSRDPAEDERLMHMAALLPIQMAEEVLDSDDDDVWW